MTEWEPGTDAEVAMRNALRTDDQESYFRILAGVDLLLPVSADALAGLEPLGWGTWSTGGRTHVLAFTSPSALQSCLADYTGSARRVAYQELAETWPNYEWWMAVNPGLPIEGYLPAWFVAQLSRGDLRMPTRGPGRDGSNAPSRIPDLQAAAMAASAAAAQGYANPASGGPVSGATVGGMPADLGVGAMAGATAASTPSQDLGSGYRAAQAGAQAAQAAGYDYAPTSAAPANYAGPSGYGPDTATPPAAPTSFGGGVAPDGGYGASATNAPTTSLSTLRAPSTGAPATGGSAADRFSPPPSLGTTEKTAAEGSGSSVGPGGLPLRTPGAVLPSGLPSRVPSTPPGMGGGGPTTSFSGFKTGGGGQSAPMSPPEPAPQAPPVPPSFQAPLAPPSFQAPPTPPSFAQPAASSVSAIPTSPSGFTSSALPSGSALDALASRSGTTAPASGPSALDALGSRGNRPAETPSVPASGSRDLPPLQPLDGPLPTRTPMAQTPPVPGHLPTPVPGEAGAEAPQTTANGLPRRQAPTSADQPSSMAAAAQALTAMGAAGATPGNATEVPPTSADPAVTSKLILPGPTMQTSAPRPAQPTAFSGQPGLGSQGGVGAQGGFGAQQGLGAQAGFGAQAGLAGSVAPPVIPGAGVPAPASRPGIPPVSSQMDQGGMGAAALSSAAMAPHPYATEFVPANDVERDLYQASLEHSTDSFLSTLLLATVLVPVADNSRPGSAPGEAGFVYRTEDVEGERFLVVFSSEDRLGDHFDEPIRTAGVRFVELIHNWPDPAWAFAVNPGSVIGAKYPGPQVIALASWAAEAGLGGDYDETPADDSVQQQDTEADVQPTMMQKAVPQDQVDFYLDRGYDRIAGFVHRVAEVEHLNNPVELFAALGLAYEGSPFQADAKEAFLLRWPAHRPSLYRIPYGGQNEQALRAMDGWVIERPPFRGNGFAPGEGSAVIAEFKVDSVRLPHGAQLWRIDADGNERIIAMFDSDAPAWRRVGEQDA
ncbi:SseB family protein [Winogradskya humida]|uniref:SseB family protein n=1 Tax=Winogradskya humida TaxID=113566 RepID=UPI0019459425